MESDKPSVLFEIDNYGLKFSDTLSGFEYDFEIHTDNFNNLYKVLIGESKLKKVHFSIKELTFTLKKENDNFIFVVSVIRNKDYKEYYDIPDDNTNIFSRKEKVKNQFNTDKLREILKFDLSDSDRLEYFTNVVFDVSTKCREIYEDFKSKRENSTKEREMRSKLENEERKQHFYTVEFEESNALLLPFINTLLDIFTKGHNYHSDDMNINNTKCSNYDKGSYSIFIDVEKILKFFDSIAESEYKDLKGLKPIPGGVIFTNSIIGENYDGPFVKSEIPTADLIFLLKQNASMFNRKEKLDLNTMREIVSNIIRNGVYPKSVTKFITGEIDIDELEELYNYEMSEIILKLLGTEFSEMTFENFIGFHEKDNNDT